jgi:hypothetical protein
MSDPIEQLAQRLGGSVAHGHLFGERGIAFMLAGRVARLDRFHGGLGNSFTRVAVGLSAPSTRTLHIAPQGFAHSFVKLFGAQDLSVGDSSFDSEYVVKANPEILVPELFSPARRERVMASVRRLSGFSQPTIDLNVTQLSVQARQFLTEEIYLMRLVQTAEDFVSYLFGASRSLPVVGVELGSVSVSSGGECPVCGGVMGEGVLRCEVCRTPHHAECWEYMGRCSTYACKGKRALS